MTSNRSGVWLCLDTATSRTSVAVVAESGEVLSESAADKSDPGQIAMSKIDAVMDLAKVSRNDLTGILLGVGPGPYTSTRVGCAIAQTLSASLRIPAVGLCTHDAIALQAATGRQQAIDHGDDWDPMAPYMVATDARRKEVYWALYDDQGSRIHGPFVDKPDVAIVRARGLLGEDMAVAGDGLDRYEELVASSGVRRIGPHLPSSSWMAKLVQSEGEVDLATLIGALHSSNLASHDTDGSGAVNLEARLFTPYPLYLRQPDAKPQASTSPIQGLQ